MFTPELADGFVIISTISLATCVMTPVLCWLLANHANAVERAQSARQGA